MAKRVIFTIVSCNYIGFAATLMQSVREHHPESDRYIILSDAMREFPDVDLAANLVCCDDVNIGLIDNMKLWYTVIEFNTAVKPFAFTHFFEHKGYDEALYIDPDILLFRPLSEVVDALVDHSCVLTPHMMHPLQDGMEPSDLTIMKSGVYNLGFLALRNDEDGRRLARWWSDRCYTSCRVDIAGNMFTDQRWMDLAPVFVDKPKILRHPGYNIAYWNLAHREVSQQGDQWLVDGLPLAFFHFSGIKPDDFEQFSKHQNRFTIENLGPARDLCTLYRKKVLANHWKKHSKTPYAFGQFPDGRPISDAARHWIARAVDAKQLDPKEPIRIRSDFFDQVDEEAEARGARLTRFMRQFWQDRSDLRAAFDIYSPHGLRAYFEWFTNGEAGKQGVDARDVLAAKVLLGGGGSAGSAASRPVRREPPWPEVSSSHWAGPSSEVGQWLRQDVNAVFNGEVRPVPRQIALLWERRLDLQQHFPCKDIAGFNAFLAWVLTSGFKEGAVSAAYMSDGFARRLAAISSISDHYGDVPIVEGMILTRASDLARGNLPLWQRFPVEKIGRMSHALWYAFCAGKAFGWPDDYTRPVRNYFMQRVGVKCDDYQLTLGAMSIWEMRPDLQAAFSLADNRSVWLYLRWLVLNGLGEIGIEVADFDPLLAQFLFSRSPRAIGVDQVTEMVYDSAPDLKAAFDLRSSEGRANLKQWAGEHLSATLQGTPAGRAHALRQTPAATQAAAAESLPVLRPRVVLSGLWSTPSGRGEDVRGSAEALLAVGFHDFLVVDTDKSKVFTPDKQEVTDFSAIEADINIVHLNADTALMDWMKLQSLKVHARCTVGFWAWELEHLPSYWRHAFGFSDVIWSATRFADDAFRAEGLRPVSLVPMVVRAPEIVTLLERSELGLQDDESVFTFVFDFRSFASRKNPEAVVQAFLMAFPAGDERVRLVIKTQGADSAPEAWARLKMLAADPRIEIRDLLMPRQELLSLIGRSDAFISLHRSEGFGRGPAEAMLLGVPVILTDYSGTADFATEDCALPVEYELVKVEVHEYPGVEQQRWAAADVRSAARQMLRVFHHREETAALGRQGKTSIEQKYGPQVVGHAMLAALDPYLGETDSLSTDHQAAP